MLTLDADQLAQLGRATADRAIGPNKIGRVAVDAGRDWMDGPAYYFNGGIGLDSQKPFRAEDMVGRGLARTSALTEKGDGGFPYIRVLTTADWAKRYGG